VVALIGFLPSLAAGKKGGMRDLYRDKILNWQFFLPALALAGASQPRASAIPACLCSKHWHSLNREWQAKDSSLVSTGEY
jgi:hypothetical protein